MMGLKETLCKTPFYELDDDTFYQIISKLDSYIYMSDKTRRKIGRALIRIGGEQTESINRNIAGVWNYENLPK